jgi:hypothetical protein
MQGDGSLDNHSSSKLKVLEVYGAKETAAAC